MSGQDLCWMSAVELLDAYRSGGLSPVEVTRAVLDRIDGVNPKINAIVTPTPDVAMEQARAAEEAYRRGDAGVLAGVPVTIKDLIATKGIRTTFGSLLFEDYVPDEDAVLVERLKGAGAVIVGKTNVPEFGLVAVTDNLIFGPALNPWDTSKTVGGSSGGAAAGVVAGFGPLAVGNDGGGSIRIPSSLCGSFGIKPHFGRIPCGPKPYHGWESMNAEGPITRSVADAALLLDVMAGPDDRDRMSLPASGVNYLESIKGGVKGLKVAYTSDLAVPAVEPKVVEITKKAAFALSELGCDVVEDDPGIFDMSQDLTVMVILETVTAHEHHLEEAREKMYTLYRPFLDLMDVFNGRDRVRVDYNREDMWGVMRRFFEKYDLLLTPTTVCPAFDFKEGGMLNPETVDGKEATPASWIGFTFPFNFTGQPAASIPCGFTDGGLPVGLQIVGRRYDEPTVLRAAAAFEAAHPWADRHPEL
jgi:aspartyl-tRNA(Asn)/glutamyl-tRNA(Gln) amidotransferase subunit A